MRQLYRRPEAAVRYRDWGDRCRRWRGIRSETLRVAGRRVHLLRADPGPDAPAGAPTQLLLHGLAGSGTAWLDVIAPLTRLGPVIAPDLPGSVFGETETRRARQARLPATVAFLPPLTAALGLGRLSVQGLSMGGLVGLQFAAAYPAIVERLVLVNPILPAPMSVPERLGWQTMGRLALAAGPAVARTLVRVWGRRLVDAKLRYLTDPGQLAAAGEQSGGDLTRISPESLALAAEQTRELRDHPARLRYAVTAFASAAASMFVSRRRALAAIDQVAAPVLLVWGDQDRLVTRPVIDHAMARRPDWRLHVLESAGHTVPLELPDAYVEAVRGWLSPPAPAGRSYDVD
ncbi:alpha/beta fold hydrolase [Natronosporangium hydrolyticum]|uniref:Alpha/beta fold hydrolase n=1 Tax=Natronosporangium hydrolyticum TaxID=2811111 RepID=A0A895YQ38_9ACTN|nr:alpha/beta fold hydrolase [Natronosporangium hydrolyticum]QSB16856.1 alpha/beta fold hydrolase [Natronosporangium hydrolyticum]